MLPKQYRLSAKDIPIVAKSGRRLAGRDQMLSIKFLPDDSLEHPQFGISISKKIDKRAAIRNRIKRRIRAAVLEILSDDDAQIGKGKYLILVNSAELANKDTKTMGIISQIV